ncbi:MAG: amino acid racemase, partial [Synergistaceae bacterium]|nr:amino acid racemase [Synergistaceae bacterium]
MKLKLGILGGMGPQATLDLQQKILDMTKAQRDSEHMRVFVDNNPQIPDRIGAVLRNTQSPAPAMQESLDKLAAMGADCVVMPCISAHYFLQQLNIPPNVIFLNMLQITAQECANCFPGLKAGVLCSEATAKSGILTPYLDSFSIPHIYAQEEDQQLLGRLILEVKAKADLHVLSARLRPVAEEMKSRGADYFVLACTELPIIVQCEPLPYPCLDATVELANAA